MRNVTFLSSLLTVTIMILSQAGQALPTCARVMERPPIIFTKPPPGPAVAIDEVPIHVTEEVRDAIAQHELPLYSERLTKLLADNNGVLTTKALHDFYSSLYFPEDLIRPRLAMARQLDAHNIAAVMGDLSFAETFRLFVGERADQVLPDSLLGRYLAETGAHLQTRSFKEIGAVGPGKVAKEGPERLLIPIDAASFEVFKKYFSGQQTYSVFGHGHLVYEGKMLYQMHSMEEQELKFPTVYSPLPMVLLKTTEGQRLRRYVTAFQSFAKGWPGTYPRIVPNFDAQGWDNPARAPWSFVPAVGGGRYIEEKPRYNCCVQWQGNMPIGDKLVTEITLPGVPPPVDGVAQRGDVPMVVKLHPPDYSDPQLAPIKNVWTFPLHQPISDLLGLAQQNGEGEFASSGWVIQSLLVSAPVERVPIVFIFTQDAKAVVNPQQALHFENPN